MIVRERSTYIFLTSRVGPFPNTRAPTDLITNLESWSSILAHLFHNAGGIDTGYERPILQEGAPFSHTVVTRQVKRMLECIRLTTKEALDPKKSEVTIRTDDWCIYRQSWPISGLEMARGSRGHRRFGIRSLALRRWFPSWWKTRFIIALNGGG